MRRRHTFFDRLARTLWFEDDPEIEAWIRWASILFCIVVIAYIAWHL